MKPTIRQLNQDHDQIEVILIPGIANDKKNKIINSRKNDIHAGEKETSIMMYINEDYVGEIEKQNDNPEFVPQSLLNNFDMTEVTEHGYWGFPEKATYEKGKKMMELKVEAALEYIEQIDKIKIKLKKEENRKKERRNH